MAGEKLRSAVWRCLNAVGRWPSAAEIRSLRMWVLKTVTEGFPETTFRILPGGIRTIGRSTGADFILDAALVSRVHCRLTVLHTGELEIRDLESTNGTCVNGEPVAASRLESGDRVRVGRVELVAERER